MRRRVTILADLEKDGNSVQFASGKLAVSANAPRQDRFSVPASSEDLNVLDHVADVFVSWSTPNVVSKPPALFSYVYEPGFHVTVVKKVPSRPPKWGEDKKNRTAPGLDHVAAFLEKQLGVVVNPKEFIESRSDYTYYSPEVGPEAFSHFVEKHSSCPWGAKNDDIFKLTRSATLHVDHNKKELVAEVTLTDMSLFLNNNNNKKHISQICDKHDRLEVGIFDRDTQDDSHSSRGVAELKGLLHDSQKDKAQETYMAIETRHNIAAGSVLVDFERPVGLHPKSQIQLKQIMAPVNHGDEPRECRLFAKYTAPSSLFFDKYQLADLERKTPQHTNGVGKLHLLWGEADLEEPRYHTDGWGSEAVVEIYVNPDLPKDSPFDLNFTLPMHLRYEEPKHGDTYQSNESPWPLVFWLCGESEEQLSSFDQSPFDVTRANYMRVFPQIASYHHIPAHAENLTISWQTPVVDIDLFNSVQIYTTLIIMAGFVLVTLAIVRKAFSGDDQVLKEKKEK